MTRTRLTQRHEKKRYHRKRKTIYSNDHDEIRTRNLLIRSQTPYPLGHAVRNHSINDRDFWYIVLETYLLLHTAVL